MTEQTKDKWLVPFDIKTVGTGEKMTITPGTINRLINKDATLEECHIYLNMCKSYGANPFLKDLHLVKYKGQRDPASYVAGIGFFEKKAQLNPKFKGYGRTCWMSEKGEWHEIFIPNKLDFGQYPVACKTICYVDGYEQAQIQTVSWAECYGRKKGGEVNASWNKQPGVMLEKVAKVRLLRKLFSAELGGLYSEDEMHVEIDSVDTNFEEVNTDFKTGTHKIGMEVPQIEEDVREPAVQLNPKPEPQNIQPFNTPITPPGELANSEYKPIGGQSSLNIGVNPNPPENNPQPTVIIQEDPNNMPPPDFNEFLAQEKVNEGKPNE